MTPAEMVAAIERSDAHVRPIMAAGAVALTAFYAVMHRLEKRRRYSPPPPSQVHRHRAPDPPPTPPEPPE